MCIDERVKAVREDLINACVHAGRKEDDVLLIGVTKYVPEERIAVALDAGITDVGENHAQELREKLTFYKQRSCGIHFIGQLQSNKIKYVCGNAKLIHSVDRLQLAAEIGKKASALNAEQNILLQVNVGYEEQKGGILPEELQDVCGAVSEIPSLRIMGLMCVPPAGTPEETRPYFARMKTLLEMLKSAYPNLPLSELSMGMSGDFTAAAEEGATMVRVGSAIFGARGRK